MFVSSHHVDRVKKQFGSEQPVPLDLVNLDGFLDMSTRGRISGGQVSISISTTFGRNAGTGSIRFRSFTHNFPPHPLGSTLISGCPRDPIVLPHDAPACGRCAGQQHPDEQWQEDRPIGGEDTDEEAEFRRQEDIPEEVDVPDQARDDTTAQDADLDGEHIYVAHEPGYDAPDVEIDFFTSADLEAARTIFQGEDSATRTAPHAPVDRPSGFQRESPPAQMHELFSCPPDVMDQIA
ncbi:hypothetical protein PIB30_071608 [Stylosanthes scabra]|uniref:Uncharacterized protein n=1 Tax=Stylosanthes scabra TaxID=79078 RepID=A0ABU6UMN1_9FABA|nr:hypothetical protein [Stylosanthes scabra]